MHASDVLMDKIRQCPWTTFHYVVVWHVLLIRINLLLTSTNRILDGGANRLFLEKDKNKSLWITVTEAPVSTNSKLIFNVNISALKNSTLYLIYVFDYSGFGDPNFRQHLSDGVQANLGTNVAASIENVPNSVESVFLFFIESNSARSSVTSERSSLNKLHSSLVSGKPSTEDRRLNSYHVFASVWSKQHFLCSL